MEFVDQVVLCWGETPYDFDTSVKWIERAGRVCYNSEDKITPTSYFPFTLNRLQDAHLSIIEHSNAVFRTKEKCKFPAYTKNLLRLAFSSPNIRVHLYNDYIYVSGNYRALLESVLINKYRQEDIMFSVSGDVIKDTFMNVLNVALEQLNDITPCIYLDKSEDIPNGLKRVTFQYVTDRSVTHELVRHRRASFSQKSQRYVKESNIQFVTPHWFKKASSEQIDRVTQHFKSVESVYLELLHGVNGPKLKAEEARSVLSNAVSSVIIMTSSVNNLKWILKLRDHDAAYPPARALAQSSKQELINRHLLLGNCKAHEITETVTLLSVRERPWHGLGDTVEHDVSVDDARKKYLVWSAYKSALHVQIQRDNAVEYKVAPNKYGIVREDTDSILGVVGSKYEIYQNSDMWDFIAMYSKSSGMSLETVGSLKGGQFTWVLLKGAPFEAIKNDPIEKYFLFRNSFTGVIPVTTLFTNIRVVCNNTLNLALNSAKNMYNIRHVHGVVSQVAEVERALKSQIKYQSQIQETMEVLAKKQITEPEMKVLLETDIFPVPPIETTSDKVIHLEDAIKRKAQLERNRQFKVKRDKKVRQILELVAAGSGADIPGVRGTAYGLLHALIEWSDHDKVLKYVSTEARTSKFEDVMFASTEFKTNAMMLLLKAA